MAVQTTLRLVFAGSGGKNINFAFPYADKSTSASQVKTLMQLMIANGDIYSEAPQTPKGAEFVDRDVTEINIS